MSAAAAEAEARAFAAAAEREAEAVQSPPPGPSPVRPSVDELFCSFEDRVEDVKVYEYDMARGKQKLAYMGTLAGVRLRQLRLAPFRCHGVPVTPLINPKTGYSSHFIIRFFYSNNPKYRVDCLVRDSDLYFVGFRRYLHLTKEEEALLLEKQREEDASSLPKKKKKKKGKGNEEEVKGGWGNWYRFLESNMDLPEFFHAEPCGMDSSYERDQATAGGFEALVEMFFTLAKFQDKPIVDTAFKKACYRFMIMFCEAPRLRSVFRMTTRRFLENVTYPVPEQFWARINNWGQMGRDALVARLRGRDLDFDISYRCTYTGLNLKTVDDLVGPHDGELLLIKSNDMFMGYTEAEIKEICEQAACKTNKGPADHLEERF